jgi:Xaa-Pro aminopeptidase
MVTQRYRERLKRCSRLMQEAELDALLLTKPANMYYLTGDGRLCAYAMITQEGKVTLGVPSTDLDDHRGGQLRVVYRSVGVRVEDTVVVGAEKSRVLTEFPRCLDRHRLDEAAMESGLVADGG